MSLRAHGGAWVERLTAPSAALVSVSERRRARLLARTLLGLIGLFAMVDVALLLNVPDYSPPWYGYIALLTSYSLARSRFARAAAVFVVLMFPIVGAIHVSIGESPDAMFTFGFLVLAILMATVLLSVRGVITTLGVNLVAMLGAYYYAPNAVGELRNLVGPMSINVLSAFLAVVYMRHRDRIEAERQTELIAARQRLEHSQRMEALGRLSGGIAHDFNNLLTVIKGNLALMDGEAFPEEIDDIERAVDSAAALTSQLLTVGRRGEHFAQPKPADELVKGAVRLIRRIIGEHVKLELKLADSAWWVEVDAHQFEQVLLNLATNARDAMPGGGHLRIETEHQSVDAARAQPHGCEAGDYVCVRVVDDGEGMAEDVRQRIFEPFFTTKPAGKGTGLGLAMVFAAMAQARGWARVESEEGVGTTFELFLPRVSTEASAAGRASLLQAPAGIGRILVVEDDAGVRQVCVRTLAAAGHDVAGAAGPATALRMIESTAFDLVLCDVVMPDFSGPELARRVKESRPELPFIFMTGYPADELEGIEATVLRKPFEPHDLVSLIEDELRRLRRVA